MFRLTMVFLVALCTIPAYAQTNDIYRKQSTWFDTYRVSHEALRSTETSAERLERTLCSPWYEIGPFKSTTMPVFYAVFPPERRVDFSERIGDLRWRKRPEWKSGESIQFQPVPQSAMYLNRTITVKRDTSLTLYLGSDDGIIVWVNGVRILADSSNRAVGPNQDTVTAPLRKGRNVLLMKIVNGAGEFGFYFSLVPMNDGLLWARLEQDFHSADDFREMSSERADSIWEGLESSTDVAGLGLRYARAYRRAADDNGTAPVREVPVVKNQEELMGVRALYLSERQKENRDLPLLTSQESPVPRINGARVFGVRPSRPFLYRIAATGDRPMVFRAAGLPAGLVLDSTSGRITGSVLDRGTYPVVFTAKNARGETQRGLKIVVGDRIALTPPLGWNSWNCFASAVTAENVRNAADAMVKSGLINHGWTYINIDDCWMVRPGSSDPETRGVPRDADGKINTNAKFPDMKALSQYVHERGLKLGLYSSPGPLTCAGFTASLLHERADAKQYADWGIDYLKYDWCTYVAHDTSLQAYMEPYRVMRAALDAVSPDIVYSLCQYGMKNVWMWGDSVGGNCWRTTGDITDTWKSMTSIGFNQAGHEPYASPGNWNDPDMLVVGWVGWGPSLHPTRLTPNEQLTHITLWSLLSAPLLIGCDMTRLDTLTSALLSNDEVLDVNQDPLGMQAHRVSTSGDLEVWSKDLEDGSKAVGLFNRGSRKARVSVRWSDIGLSGTLQVRDLWRQKDLAPSPDLFAADIPRHGAMLVRVSSSNQSATAPH